MSDDETTDTSTDETTAEEETFTAAYVRELRTENAERRRAAQAAEERAQGLAERVLAAEVREQSRDVLADPSDLIAFSASADLLDDGGDPDPARIRAAAEALAAAKPHLAARRPPPDVGQGPRGAPVEAVDTFGALIRQAAR